MKINGNEKISRIIKHNPLAIDAIASVNPHFKKLKNPILRRVLAPRVTVAEAARLGKCDEEEIFRVLVPLGFEVSDTIDHSGCLGNQKQELIQQKIDKGAVEVLDVRPVLAEGEDPLKMILRKLKEIPKDKVLNIVNTFEPIPLINLLKGKGYESLVVESGEVVNTYFLKTEPPLQQDVKDVLVETVSVTKLEQLKREHKNGCTEVDVRDLEMPLPLVTILEAVENLPIEEMLYVRHKKNPQHLLPELAKRSLKTWVANVGPGDVRLLIHAVWNK